MKKIILSMIFTQKKMIFTSVVNLVYLINSVISLALRIVRIIGIKSRMLLRMMKYAAPSTSVSPNLEEDALMSSIGHRR
jgi:hypothetical protein